MKNLTLIVLSAFAVLTVSGCAETNHAVWTKTDTSQSPLPRVGIKQGQDAIGSLIFRNSGAPFVPTGFNHTVLGPPNQHHVVFNVGQYDPQAMEADLEGMSKAGANTVRLWAWGDVADGTGVVGPKESEGVNAAYVGNFIDFLRRCRRHGIYVIAVLDECPLNKGYAAVADREKLANPCPAVTDYNMQYLSAPFIKAKAALIHDFIGAIKRYDPALLTCVLAWSFCNEAFVFDTFGPFNQRTGLVTTANGKAYDMADRDQRQACWDDGIVYWANELTRAVKEVDPDALVTAGVFTSDAQGRMPYNGIMEARPDSRYPPRPSVMASAACRLDFLDIHVYPFDGGTDVNLATNEYAELKRLGQPVLAGEYGIFRAMTKPENAIAQERLLRQNIQRLGYGGPLLWIWNLIPGSNTYVADELGMR